jgi:hypothetical protein
MELTEAERIFWFPGPRGGANREILAKGYNISIRK